MINECATDNGDHGHPGRWAAGRDAADALAEGQDEGARAEEGARADRCLWLSLGPHGTRVQRHTFQTQVCYDIDHGVKAGAVLQSDKAKILAAFSNLTDGAAPFDEKQILADLPPSLSTALDLDGARSGPSRGA